MNREAALRLLDDLAEVDALVRLGVHSPTVLSGCSCGQLGREGSAGQPLLSQCNLSDHRGPHATAQ